MKKTSALQSAFFNPRILLAFALCSIGLLIALTGFGVFTSASALAQDPSSNEASDKQQQVTGMISGISERNDVLPSLRGVPPWPVGAKGMEREANLNPKIGHDHLDVPDPVVQNAHASMLARLTPLIPAPIRNFDGIPFPGVGCNCAPPDTDGEVGATQYVQMVNEAYQVFNKDTGASVLGPLGIQAVWTGFGGVCETGGSGDPVVLYDQLANRWLISQFAGSPPRTECIAVSQTSDATGAWNRYAFVLNTVNFYDYPKLGVWPDGYYMSMNIFNSAGSAFLGTQAWAFDRAAMLAGTPATFVTPGITAGGAANEAFLPADLDGSILPTAGAPATFVETPGSGNGNVYRTWHFDVDFVTPANSTFTVFANPVAAVYTALCPTTRACVPQLGGTGTNSLDAIADRLMFRLAYRKFGDGHEAVVGNFTVSSGGVAGIRWFELRNVTAGPVTVFQESTYQPDTVWRWMGSAAMDNAGNLAIGFSASDATINPQIRYAGRLVSDPLNTLAQGEATLHAGTGSQTGTGNRWGDYSALSIDPVDDQTFWYTQEYYATTGSFAWRTRIGAFKFSSVPANLIIAGGSSIVSAGGNGVLDPGETVTVSLGLVNAGGPGVICTTAATTGTLQATGGVTSPSGPQNYGALCSGSPAVFRNFTFTVDPALPCGNNVVASLAVVDGATNYGTITFTFPTGTPTVVPVQNFDSVTAPALPAGWTTTFSGSGTAATTVTTFPDTAPNAAFTSEAGTVGLSELTSPPIAITSGGTKLSFRNEFNTEVNFDGKVLEISIPGVAGGAFQDIIAAGGTFSSGGYNSTMPTTFMNPLPNRAAWSGLSGGTAAAPAYITTVVALPPSATGQNVQFKWRQGSDATVVPATNPGSRIDTLILNSTTCAGAAPVPSSAVSRKTHGGSGPFDITLPLVPIGGAVGIEDRTGLVANAHQMVVTFPGAVTLSGVSVTSGTGSATFSGGGTAVITIDLTGVTNAQRIAVTLANVNNGSATGNVVVPMGVLSGDTNGNGSVNAGDVGQTKAQSGAVVGAGNFRTDVNSNGSINAGDVGLVKSRSGTALPP
jgi:hypothetical protein